MRTVTPPCNTFQHSKPSQYRRRSRVGRASWPGLLACLLTYSPVKRRQANPQRTWVPRRAPLPYFYFTQPVRALEDFARLAAVGRADDAVALHHVQNARRPAVTQPQMALQGGGGSLAHLQYEAHGLFVHGVLRRVGGFSIHRDVLVARRGDEERLVVLRRRLLLPAIHDAADFRLGDEGPVEADEARRSRRKEQHVALAQQVLGAHAVEDGARIHPGGHAEADPRGEVRLDDAGDDVHAGALRGQHQVHADGARHLRQARDAFLDVAALEHHEVGQLVDENHDVGQRLEVLLGLLLGE